MLTYLKYGAYEGQVDNYDSLYFWPKYSLGNMGSATNQCNFRPFTRDALDLVCPYGFMSEIVPDGIGINRNGNLVRDGCISNPLFFNKECSDFVDVDEVTAYFDTHCAGKEKCLIPLDSSSSFFKRNSGDEELEDKCFHPLKAELFI